MRKDDLARQFAGQARLVRLLLWKVGETTDIDICLDTGLEQGLLGKDDVDFLRPCLEAEEEVRPESAGASVALPFDIDQGAILRLRRCVDKLNRADCA